MAAQLRRFVEQRVLELEKKPVLEKQQTQISVTLPPELHEKFDQLSRYHGLSKAEQISEFVEKAPSLLESECELENLENDANDFGTDLIPE